MNKNVRIRVRENCAGTWWDYAIYVNNRRANLQSICYTYKAVAIRSAKAMAKKIGIKYDSEIIKKHGC